MEQVIQVPVEIPFHGQYVSADNYQSEGYASLEEGLFWSERSCGIASVRMVIDGVRRQRGQGDCPDQATVLRHGVEIGAYQPGTGWIHSGLVRIAGEYGVYGERHHDGMAEDVGREIRLGHPCIVSVSPHFAGGTRRPDGSIVGRGGHLVVVYGCYTDNGALTGFLTHHPSCFPAYTWPAYRVDIRSFDRSFSGNYLSFDPERTTKA